MDHDATWYREVGLSPCDFVLDRDPASPSLKRGRSPSQFSAHVYFDQTPGWTKMPFLSKPNRHCVRWGRSFPSSKRGAEPPIFGPYLLWPNGWMDQDATWHGCRSRLRLHCATWGPSSPPPKGGRAPNFLPISIVAKWLDASRCHLVWR